MVIKLDSLLLEREEIIKNRVKTMSQEFTGPQQVPLPEDNVEVITQLAGNLRPLLLNMVKLSDISNKCALYTVPFKPALIIEHQDGRGALWLHKVKEYRWLNYPGVVH